MVLVIQRNTTIYILPQPNLDPQPNFDALYDNAN